MYKQKYKEGQQIHKNIYLYICRYVKKHRYAPSYKEIADGVGVSSAPVWSAWLWVRKTARSF